jgi:uncharacterized protein
LRTSPKLWSTVQKLWKFLAIEGTQASVLELRTDPSDVGKVIGREGRTAKAIRTLLGAGRMKLHKRYTLEIIES